MLVPHSPCQRPLAFLPHSCLQNNFNRHRTSCTRAPPIQQTKVEEGKDEEAMQGQEVQGQEGERCVLGRGLWGVVSGCV